MSINQAVWCCCDTSDGQPRNMTFQDAATAKGLFLNLVALCCKWNVSYQQRQRMDVVMSVHETGPPL